MNIETITLKHKHSHTELICTDQSSISHFPYTYQTKYRNFSAKNLAYTIFVTGRKTAFAHTKNFSTSAEALKC